MEIVETLRRLFILLSLPLFLTDCDRLDLLNDVRTDGTLLRSCPSGTQYIYRYDNGNYMVDMDHHRATRLDDDPRIIDEVCPYLPLIRFEAAS